MKKLIIENTYRSLLIYMLYDPLWKKRDYILIRGRISEAFIQRFKSKVTNVDAINGFPILSKRAPFSFIFTRCFLLKKIKNSDEIYGNVFELKLRKIEKPLIQIDDGLLTKSMLFNRFSYSITNLFLKNNFLFRLLLNIEYKVDINNFSFIVPDSYIGNKYNCRFINLNNKINKLSDVQYQEICDVFGFIPKKLKGKSILLLQPFFEDRLVSSINYEISMYKHILIAEGIEEKNLYIKPHPRSTINYKEYFKTAEFISKDFPYELLVRKSNNNKFKKAISVHSSGLEELITIAEEVVSFGTSEFCELELFPMKRIK